jgi:pimeloyl-ACP methyl ester carboxylesterase
MVRSVDAARTANPYCQVMSNRMLLDHDEFGARDRGRREGTSVGTRTESVAAHLHDVSLAHDRMLGGSAARSRFIEVRSGRRVHVIEAGEGSPVLFLHGSNTSSLSLLPLFDRLEGVRAIAVDRPGFGLSDPVHVPRQRFREAAIEFIDNVLDELKLEPSALAGQSAGGTWALWYALARPERVHRLALVGSAPLLPGTRVPAPLRVLATPVIGDLLARVKLDAQMVVQLMSSMGEKDTIVRYPNLIDAIVAGGNDPIASAANLAEIRAVISPFGFRRSMRIQPNELRSLNVPTLVIWGDHDPVGAVKVAQAVASLLPQAQLEVLPAGHVPYLGCPDRVAELLSRFTGS